MHIMNNTISYTGSGILWIRTRGTATVMLFPRQSKVELRDLPNSTLIEIESNQFAHEPEAIPLIEAFQSSILS